MNNEPFFALFAFNQPAPSVYGGAGLTEGESYLIVIPSKQSEINSVSKTSKAKKKTKSKQVTQSTQNIRAARVLILQILYEIDLVGHHVADTLTYHLDEAELEYKFERFVRSMVLGVLEHQATLDDYIEQLAPSWPLDQMAAVERNILRMGMYELLHHPETSQSIVIHEAIQLARHYGASSSRRFVNGVLGSFISKYLGKDEDA